MIRLVVLTAATVIFGLGFLAETAGAKVKEKIKAVDCGAGGSIQAAVDAAVGPTTIFISGTCVEDVFVTSDDITLSGNQAGDSCNKANPGGTGTIDGTVTVDGVRARIEFLTITGSGDGVAIFNRADVRLTCNDISDNEANGVVLRRNSNAVLRDNTVSGNGTRTADPFIFFDCGLLAADASSVDSRGNTYEDNQYCAIEADRQSSIRIGAFLPRTPGNPADPNDRDVITERGCNPATGSGCFTDDEGPVAIEVWLNGVVEIRNADVSGEIEASALSIFRVDDDVVIQGNIRARFGSLARISDRFTQFGGDRSVSFTGQMLCFDTSQTFFSNVQCTQICNGLPSQGACRFPQCNDGIDNDGVQGVDLDDPDCSDSNDDDESS